MKVVWGSPEKGYYRLHYGECTLDAKCSAKGSTETGQPSTMAVNNDGVDDSRNQQDASKCFLEEAAEDLSSFGQFTKKAAQNEPYTAAEMPLEPAGDISFVISGTADLPPSEAANVLRKAAELLREHAGVHCRVIVQQRIPL